MGYIPGSDQKKVALERLNAEINSKPSLIRKIINFSSKILIHNT